MKVRERRIAFRKSIMASRLSCEECGASGRLLMHHIRYPAEGEVERPEDVRVLCPKCHVTIHKKVRVIKPPSLFPFVDGCYDGPLVAIADVASRLCVSKHSIIKWAKLGYVTVYRFDDGHYEVPESELDRIMTPTHY